MNNSRKKLMDQIQENLRSELEALKVTEGSDLNNLAIRLLAKKLEKRSVRSFFTHQMYKYIIHLANSKNLSIRKLSKKNANINLPFIIEAVMSVMYLHNQVFDRKQKVKNCEEASKKLLGSSLLKDRIYDYIYMNFKPMDRDIVQRYVREMFRSVDTGQFFDKFSAGVPKKISSDKEVAKRIRLESIEDIIAGIQHNFEESEKESVRIYFERNYLISSSLFKYTSELILELVQYQETVEKDNILKFSECYGVTLQLINDICDFIFESGTNNKDSEDVLSDLRNNIITLPILLHNNQKEKNSDLGLVKKFLETKDLSFIKEKHNEILKEMILSHALQDSLKIGKRIAEKARTYLDSNNEIYAPLRNLFSIASYNKYYYHIFAANRFYKKKENRNKIYHCEEKKSSLKIRPKYLRPSYDMRKANYDEGFYYACEQEHACKENQGSITSIHKEVNPDKKFKTEGSSNKKNLANGRKQPAVLEEEKTNMEEICHPLVGEMNYPNYSPSSPSRV